MIIPFLNWQNLGEVLSRILGAFSFAIPKDTYQVYLVDIEGVLVYTGIVFLVSFLLGWVSKRGKK